MSAGADDTIETDSELLARMGTDGYLWATEYIKRFGGDVGTLAGWFADAIAAGACHGVEAVQALIPETTTVKYADHACPDEYADD